MSERQRKKLAQKEALKLKRKMIEKVKSNNVAFNLNHLVDGWLELESDPGTFSLLIEDFGCCGAQVEEIYDLEQKFEGPVFGFIFLFKWLNNQPTNDRARSQKSLSNSTDQTFDKDGEQQQDQKQWSYVKDETIISEMFFAKQMISNSCATHALISILLNCDYAQLKLGPVLKRLKEHTQIMDPENKGYAISNLPEIAKAHNSHASYSSLYNRNRSSSHSGMSYMISGNQRTNLQQQKHHEAYHFVSYVPIKNRLYELDGLKNHPIDHGPFGPKEDWTEKFRSIIKQRLSANKNGDDSANEIRYNLMAVVPDKRINLRDHLRKLQQYQSVVQHSIQRLTQKVFTPLSVDTADIPNPPYSPLSTGTLTASESGSRCNSPEPCEDASNIPDASTTTTTTNSKANKNKNIKKSTYTDDDANDEEDRINNKYFFIKFNDQIESIGVKEDNSEPAHKNCIIELETCSVPPMNLSIDEKTQDCQGIIENHKSPTKASNEAPQVTEDKPIESAEMEAADDNDSGKKQSVDDVEIENSSSKEAIQTNGIGITGDSLVNETQAHKNDMYNLSSKPPFDFNILDDMQHVHFAKSTLSDMKHLSRKLSLEIGKIESLLTEELDKRRKYKIDNNRRTHNYEPFIMTFLSMLAKHGKLADLIEKDLGIITEDPTTATTNSTLDSVNQKPVNNTTNNKATTIATSNKVLSTPNGGMNSKTNHVTPKTTTTTTIPSKPKYKYVSTGRPVGRPRKNPLVPPPVKTPNNNNNNNTTNNN